MPSWEDFKPFIVTGLRLALGRGDTVPAPGARLYAQAFGDQPCGTVINANAAPGGGSEFLFVAQISAIAGGPSTSLRSGVPEIIGCIRPRISLRDQAAVHLNCSTGDVRRGVRA